MKILVEDLIRQTIRHKVRMITDKLIQLKVDYRQKDEIF